MGETYLRQKCGNRLRPGIKRKAGNVIRLKVPRIMRNARMALAKMLECCY